MMATAATKTNFTLVIDAGHGGGDSGAVGAISKEKNLTLKFALAFGRLVEENCPDVKVVYTRKTDKFVELYRRAEIANQNKADLFISIHINSLPKGRVARGFQTYTLGTSKRTGKKNGVLQNLEVAKRENSVIFLEKDYKQTYKGYDPNSPESDIMFEFIQDKNMENSVELAKYMQKYVCQATGRQDMGAQQDNLAVLRMSSMPGALLELGFISTRDEEDFMNSSRAETLYARGIFNAFLNYRKRHGGSITIPYMKMDDPVPEPPVVEEARVEPIEAKSVKDPEPEVVEAPQAEIKQPEVKKPETKKPAASSDAPVFKVQILSSSSKLKSTDARFKGLKDIDFYQDGGMYKYTVGASTNYNEIYRLRKEVAAKIPEAFIIAFKDGKRMDVNAAIREFKSKK
jgi:N-acetylmuramoyl-L-alanine amidase